MTTPTHGPGGGPTPYEERDVAIRAIVLTAIAPSRSSWRRS
jgi:hypothetical protein